MKRISLPVWLALIMILFIFFSCKKSSSSSKNQTSTAISYWRGTQTQMADLNIQTFTNIGLYSSNKLVIYPGDETDTASAPEKFYGSYTLSGNNFSGTFNDAANGAVTWTGAINTSVTPNVLTGNFTSDNGSYHGTFNLTKQ